MISTLICLLIPVIFVFIFFQQWRKKQKSSENETLDPLIEENGPKIVIDPAKAFCQRMKFVVRLKKRMREFKSRKDAMEQN